MRLAGAAVRNIGERYVYSCDSDVYQWKCTSNGSLKREREEINTGAHEYETWLWTCMGTNWDRVSATVFKNYNTGRKVRLKMGYLFDINVGSET